MIRDAFYYGKKPNVHPREKFAKSLADARQQATTEHFWIINEFCDYRGFDWDFDFDFLPDEDVWAEEHNNIWPSVHQKDSGTWLCPKEYSDINIYRADVDPLRRKNEIHDAWNLLENIDTNKFDFGWHPDPTDPPYIYAWGCKYFPVEFKICLEYKVPGATEYKYMNTIVELLPNWDCIREVQPINRDKFDLSWRPDPRDPPYIYVWGNKHISGDLKSTLEYHVEGATEYKYMPELLEVLPEMDKWVISELVDKNEFDFTWRPDPREPAYIYVWGNKHVPAEVQSTIEYHCPGASERKYINDVKVKLKSDPSKFKTFDDVENFDYSWIPDPTSPPYIYVWGNKYVPAELKPTVEYHCEGATERKYMGDVDVLPELDKWKIYQQVTNFDMSWRPDPREPAYIYTWGNKYVPAEIKPTIEYHCDEATERKYMGNVDVLPELDKWKVIQPIDKSKFDLSWRPDPREPAYIYTWGNKWVEGELSPTLEYHCQGATERKYMGEVDVLPELDKWKEHQLIDKTKFDLTWRPDPREPAYIYTWGNKYVPAEIKPTLEYHCIGSTERKYMGDVEVLPELDKWNIIQSIDTKTFDLSWRPDPREPAYIYVWGNKHIPGELKSTIEYHCEGATEYKYMGNADVLPDYDRWVETQPIDKSKFDLTWRPDPREPAYIYTWGNKYVPAEFKPTLEYYCEGATERKYMGDVEVLPEYDRWDEVQKVTNFDFTWRPDPREPAYVYVWGNKYIPGEIKPTLMYTVPGAEEVKYMGDVEVLPETHKWRIHQEITNFDMSWRPDPREPAYIYTWGNKYVPAEIKPTLEYYCEDATERKYMGDVEVLPEYSKWKIYQQVTNFDMAWRPDPREPAYIYTWGNKYIPAEIKPTIEFRCEGATERKYMGDAEVLPEIQKWRVYQEITNFDMSWRPDPREPAFIYVWGNKYVPAEIKPTIEYHCEGATERKYMGDVDILPELHKWKIYEPLKDFDLTWRPDPREPAYIYTWGNKYVPAEIKPTLEYYCEDATERKYMGDVEILPDSNAWKIYQQVTNFDMSWRPDPREPAYIYVWGNKYVPGELEPTLEYYCDGATEKKYMGNVDVLPQNDRWKISIPVDTSLFDLCWRPDPREPAYIYTWGNKYVPAELRPTVEYYTPGATERKYMGEAPVLPQWDNYKIHAQVTNFDFSWMPDPREPAYIYTWGNKYIPAELQPTIEYYVDGATERKYMGNVDVLPELNRWFTYQENTFDLSWRPDPREPAYIYTWGNKYVPAEIQPTLEYRCPGATERKYMGEVDVLPEMSRWKMSIPIDKSKFDMSWRPDPREPAYIYTWGNKYVPAELRPTLEYYCEGATERKYMGEVDVLPQWNNYKIHTPIKNFDFTWMPDPREPAYIYTWGNKYVPAEIQPTLEYHCDGATERKYMGDVEVLPLTEYWVEHQTVDKSKFDMSWRPDPREPAYIYTWGNKYVPAEIKPTIEFRCEGATERKYMGNVDVLPELDKWREIQAIDKSKFDLSWRPDPREPAYIYVWGNKYIRPELQSTLEYHVEGATEKKYIQDPIDVLPEYDKWNIVQSVTNFDFAWRPDPREPAYIYTWGNKWISGELKPTVEYHCPNATERKYMGDADVEPEWNRYQILIPIDKRSFDFTWRPDPREPAFIYVWGNQSNSAEVEPTIEYHCDGATERKYMSDRVAKTLPNSENWKVLIPVDNFDYSWRPDPGSPPYIYVFGNQWHDAMTEPTVEYHVEGATDKKYITDIVATVSKTQENWKTLISIDSFDYSWRPNPHSQPYIYVFGNQWHDAVIEPTVEYHQPGATDRKYISEVKAIVKSTATESQWKRLIPVESFDYSWRPDPGSPPYIYVFGNKWNNAATEPTIEYHCVGAVDKKYIDTPVATPKAELQYWKIHNNDDLETFDFTWRPNPHSPPQIYQWADNGPTYTVPGATEVVLMQHNGETRKKVINRYKIKTTLEDLIAEHSDEVFWALNPDLNYDKFDFSWTPNEENFRHINVFGNEYSKNTQTYYVNGPMYVLGYREYNYIETQKVETTDSNLSMFFIDKGNTESNSRFAKLKELYPKLQKTRYLNTWVDTINRCIRKSETKLFWVLSSEIDYTDFSFDFYPSPWQMKMIHVFGTQWSHWGNTYLINGETFTEDTKYVKIIEHLNNLNFVKTKRAKANECLYDIYLIDHGNYEVIDILVDLEEKANGRKIETVKYRQNYLETFKDILSKLETKNDHYIWVCSSVCHYDNFDFSYICDPFAREHLHVFPSDKQKFGDTFLINVNELRRLVNHLYVLEEYGEINFNNHQKLNRIRPPEIISKEDTHYDFAKHNFKFPYAVFKTSDHAKLVVKDEEPMSLWSDESKSIIISGTGGTRIVVPKEAKNYVKNELYDYPFVKRVENVKSQPLDIVFLSNGEPNAEQNYERLLSVTKGLPNRVVRVDGVNGRVAAYHAAANASNTPWMFTVFAKLWVNEYFNWDWQPDRLQLPKHYIFTATNPVNELEYGHQAMIAYNKKLVLNNTGVGLDFTLDSPHESVDINSGIAAFDTDEYSTWRTAFREAIKLNLDGTVKSLHRLNIWLTVGIGPYGYYSTKGASDGIKYYTEVNGDIDKLKLSYEWEWLKDRYKHDNP